MKNWVICWFCPWDPALDEVDEVEPVLVVAPEVVDPLETDETVELDPDDRFDELKRDDWSGKRLVGTHPPATTVYPG